MRRILTPEEPSVHTTSTTHMTEPGRQTLEEEEIGIDDFCTFYVFFNFLMIFQIIFLLICFYILNILLFLSHVSLYSGFNV